MSDKEDNALLTMFGVISGVVLLTFWGAFVFIKLWNWFAVPFLKPIIPELPPMTYPFAIGLKTLVGIVNIQTPNNNEKTIGSTLGYAFFVYAIALFIGWITQMFM